MLGRLTRSGEQAGRLREAGRQHLQALAGCLTADEPAVVTRGLGVLAAAVRRQAGRQAATSGGHVAGGGR